MATPARLWDRLLATKPTRCSTHPGEPWGGCRWCDTFEGPDVYDDVASDAECDGRAADEVWGRGE